MITSTIAAILLFCSPGQSICYHLQDSSYLADYQGYKQDGEMAAGLVWNGDQLVSYEEYAQVKWLDQYEMKTTLYDQSGCVEWYGINESETSTCLYVGEATSTEE
jgi:hypothetical protein